jgi:hypothetical protein
MKWGGMNLKGVVPGVARARGKVEQRTIEHGPLLESSRVYEGT